MPSSLIIAVVVLAALLLLAVFSLRVVREYQRVVAFRLGRLRGALGPGIVIRLPFLDTLIPVDLRVVTLTIPPQEVITRDNVTARVNAVVMFKVADPVRSVMAVENHAMATSQFAQTTLRSVVGRADLDTLLAHRADLNEDLYQSIARQAVPWGVEVTVVEIKDVEIPEMMQRAMARQAEAERERRAKVISAHGELEASHELRDAALTLGEAPASLQLRYLQTLLELGADQNSTVVFPLPMDIIGPLMGAIEKVAPGARDDPAPRTDPPPRTEDRASPPRGLSVVDDRREPPEEEQVQAEGESS
jgi:regulator of protease activity HflC (stomatin/prohibitin superfamily)